MKIEIKSNIPMLVLAASLLAGTPQSATAATIGDWDTQVIDQTALGSVYIRSNRNHRRAPSSPDDSRIARYNVNFPAAGSYDLYARLKSTSDRAGLNYSRNLSLEDSWQGVGPNVLSGEGFEWVNLSQVGGRGGRGGHTFTVEAPGILPFSISTNRQGFGIDAFAFGATGTTFTDAQLDAAALENAVSPELIGFQAQFANSFGSDTICDEGLEMKRNVTAHLLQLRERLVSQVPEIDPARVAAWQSAIEAEEEFAKEAASTAAAVARMKGAEERLRRHEEDLKLGPRTLEDAQDAVTQARARGDDDSELESAVRNAERLLSLRQRDVRGIERNIERAKKDLEDAKTKLPQAIRDADAARQAHEAAMARTWAAMDALGTHEMIQSNRLDNHLAQYMIISDATPRRLARFAVQSPGNELLIQQLFNDTDLMVKILVADGPTAGNYGQAMVIYNDIQQASPRAKEGIFQQLALAVSLGHARPITRRDHARSTGTMSDDESDDTAPSSTDPSSYIDPVQRYLNYEKWYLAGELDAGFKDLCAWSLVMVVDGRDCDKAVAWGRAMLNILRPDTIPADGNTALYIDFLDHEIAYGSNLVSEDRPELMLMQNILANGGICGRRAFFGRFLLRSFGVPTTARAEPGHATLAHWHPEGWQVKLGGNWGPGNRGRFARMNRTRSSPYGVDMNFLASTQARKDADSFVNVKRARWISALVGESRQPGFYTTNGRISFEDLGFWNALALHEQRRIIAGLDAKEASSPSPASTPTEAPVATGTITVDSAGAITIPAAATSYPTESTAKIFRHRRPDLILFIKDREGDTRLHLSRNSSHNDTFTYTFDAPVAGKYLMHAKVSTPRWDRMLIASANDGAEVEFPLPYTIGLWGKSEPVEIELKAGTNELTFRGPSRVTIDHFTLTPVR